MAQSSFTLNKILDFIYQHLTEEDWEEGLSLKQADKVHIINQYQNLIMARVYDSRQEEYEVRIKSHPSSKVIQWLECTCHENRKGYFCSHIAALVIHLSQENHKFIEGLEIGTSAKPIKSKKVKSTGAVQKVENASFSILEKIKNSITKIDFNKKTGHFDIESKVGLGAKNRFELEIDVFARYIGTLTKDSTFQGKKKYRVIEHATAHLGWFVYENNRSNEEIIAEKVVGISYEENTTADYEKIKESPDIIEVNSELDQTTDLKAKKIQIIAMEKNLYRLGKDYIYLADKGFIVLAKTDQSKSLKWKAAPYKDTYKDDRIPHYFEKIMPYELEQNKKVWTNKSLFEQMKVISPSLHKINLKKTKNEGWFNLCPSYKTDSVELPMVDLIVQSQTHQRSYLKTAKGWLKIPDFIKENQWNYNAETNEISTDFLGVIRLQALTGDLDNYVGSIKAIQMSRSKEEFSKRTNTPKLQDSKLKLRSYQKEGYDWLWWLYQNELHGLLADDMGIGKTHQAMAILSAIQQEKIKTRGTRFLIICPTTVLDHWFDQIEKFAPKLSPLKYHGNKRFHHLKEQDKNASLITSYGILLRDIRELSSYQWDAVILDEAHYVKNNKTNTYNAACQLKSRFKLCLTGTPMENHLSELKNIFDFLVPGHLGSNKYFKKNFLTPINQEQNVEKQVLLQKLIYPLKLRRTKNEVLKELPEKIEDLRYCSLTTEQVSLYKQVLKQKARPLLEKLEQNSEPIPYLHVFTVLQMLKQITNHPSLVVDGENYKEKKSGKFELLKDILREALDSGQKIVIFSQYVKMVKIIVDYCTEIGVECLSLTGTTTERGKIVKKFQEDANVKVFVSSLLAGGMGIDLTSASIVIHYDRWWNASKENQATDRVHRIGQKKSVQVFKLITKGTLEEKINKLIDKKSDTFSQFLEHDQKLLKKFSRQDIIELLQ